MQNGAGAGAQHLPSPPHSGRMPAFLLLCLKLCCARRRTSDLSLSLRGGRRGAWWKGKMLLGDRSKCTRKRPLHQNAARRQQGGVSLLGGP